MRPLFPPLLLAALTVATAPFLGILRDALFARFPGSAVRILAGALALLAVGILGLVVHRVLRSPDRPRRLALLVVAALLLVGQAIGFGTADTRTNIVEKIHIVQYGLLAFLFFRALGSLGSIGNNGTPGDGPRVGPTRLALPVVWATLVGLLDESTQGFFQMRTGDVRDVAINAISALAGLLVALALSSASSAGSSSDSPATGVRLRPSRREARRILDWTAVLVLVGGLFVAEMHLGHWIVDPQIGRFRSFFDEAELRRLAADRARRWAVDPPTGLVPWAPEDYYLTEAGWHANHRNERMRAGDATLALQANRILERYYDPFLDLPSFRGAGRHRLPPATVRELEAEALDVDPLGYTSPVLAGRIWTRPPKRPFLATLAVSALVLIAAGRARRESEA